MIYLHYNLSKEEWFFLPITEQIANIGTEIGRTINWKSKDAKKSAAAFDRALELLDLTIEDKKNHGSSLRELCRLKAALVDYFMGKNEYGSSETLWNNYFYFFNNIASVKYFKQ